MTTWNQIEETVFIHTPSGATLQKKGQVWSLVTKQACYIVAAEPDMPVWGGTIPTLDDILVTATRIVEAEVA